MLMSGIRPQVLPSLSVLQIVFSPITANNKQNTRPPTVFLFVCSLSVSHWGEVHYIQYNNISKPPLHVYMLPLYSTLHTYIHINHIYSKSSLCIVTPRTDWLNCGVTGPLYCMPPEVGMNRRHTGHPLALNIHLLQYSWSIWLRLWPYMTCLSWGHYDRHSVAGAILTSRFICTPRHGDVFPSSISPLGALSSCQVPLAITSLRVTLRASAPCADESQQYIVTDDLS